MNKVKTAIIIITSLLLIGILVFFLPTEKILSNIPLFKNLYNNTTILISTKVGKATVMINGEDYGETPTTISDLEPGSYTITMEKITEGDSFYKPHNFTIDLTRNTEAIIDVEIGPGDIISGYILYYTPSPKTSGESGYLSIQSTPKSADVYIDSDFFSTVPISARQLKAGDYQLQILANSYDELSLPIIIREGYNMNITTYQFPIPINLETIELENGEDS